MPRPLARLPDTVFFRVERSVVMAIEAAFSFEPLVSPSSGGLVNRGKRAVFSSDSGHRDDTFSPLVCRE
jgi:hypothetical protein